MHDALHSLMHARTLYNFSSLQVLYEEAEPINRRSFRYTIFVFWCEFFNVIVHSERTTSQPPI